jgi:hypothetical protein
MIEKTLARNVLHHLRAFLFLLSDFTPQRHIQPTLCRASQLRIAQARIRLVPATALGCFPALAPWNAPCKRVACQVALTLRPKLQQRAEQARAEETRRRSEEERQRRSLERERDPGWRPMQPRW